MTSPPRCIVGGTLAVNLDKPYLWNDDVAQSVDLYNNWFMMFAPKVFRETRVQTTKAVEEALAWTNNIRDVSASILRAHPNVITMLRMATCPPLARDRLIGLAGISPNLVYAMEVGKIPPRMAPDRLEDDLTKIGAIIEKMSDRDVFPWLDSGKDPTDEERHRAATIVADRLCGAVADPIIRNAQERRQLREIETWLTARGYQLIPSGRRVSSTGWSPVPSASA